MTLAEVACHNACDTQPDHCWKAPYVRVQENVSHKTGPKLFQWACKAKIGDIENWVLKENRLQTEHAPF